MQTKRLFIITFTLLALVMGLFTVRGVAAANQKIRWDIMSVTGDNQGKAIFDVGAPAYATSYNSSMIKLTGSGTFGTGPSDPVTGGGKWVTFDYDENQTG